MVSFNFGVMCWQILIIPKCFPRVFKFDAFSEQQENFFFLSLSLQGEARSLQSDGLVRWKPWRDLSSSVSIMHTFMQGSGVL